jgi:hypothetical protein
MFYLKLWFYVIGALAYGPFETQAECEDTRAYHERQAKQPASEPCFQGWEERGLELCTARTAAARSAWYTVSCLPAGPMVDAPGVCPPGIWLRSYLEGSTGASHARRIPSTRTSP